MSAKEREYVGGSRENGDWTMGEGMGVGIFYVWNSKAKFFNTVSHGDSIRKITFIHIYFKISYFINV